MAYFSNSTEGEILDNQCMQCKLYEEGCPIAIVQELYNYDQITVENAGHPQMREAMNILIDESGICKMYVLVNK